MSKHDLRKLARAKPCMIRVMGVCNGNTETTVLAHYRLAGTSGASFKPDDMQGAWACSACHDAVDRRVPCQWAYDLIRLWHAEGVMRTQAAIRRMTP